MTELIFKVYIEITEMYKKMMKLFQKNNGWENTHHSLKVTKKQFTLYDGNLIQNCGIDCI